MSEFAWDEVKMNRQDRKLDASVPWEYRVFAARFRPGFLDEAAGSSRRGRRERTRGDKAGHGVIVAEKLLSRFYPFAAGCILSH